MRDFLLLVLLAISVMGRAQDFDWEGHRGARGLRPENTLPAFEKALEIGVKTLEMDVVISGDNQVVVSHDPWFSPVICLTPDLKKIPANSTNEYNIFKMSYTDIRKYNCGSLGNPAFPDQQAMAAHKPLLVDVFKMAEKYDKDYMRKEIFYNIEIKSDPDWEGIFQPSYRRLCDLVYHTIDAYVPWKRVTVQSFDLRVLDYIHDKYPEVRLALLDEISGDPEKEITKLGFKPSIYSPEYHLLKIRKVKWLHDQNIKVIPWTVNDIHDMEDLINMKVDGLITDYPNLMKSFPETLDP